MIETRTVERYRQWREKAVGSGSCRPKTIGFVPTMGALHEGHISLLQSAREKCDFVVCSLFLNPTQFNRQEDLDSYPSSLIEDLDACRQAGVDCVFLPSRETLYPDDYRFRMTEVQESLEREGKFRPGHFDGVLSVVLKLLLVVKPSHAWFGEKDWQQLRLVEGMVSAYFLDVIIERGATVREKDGLAMSSRNRRLSTEGRSKASFFHRALVDSPTPKEARNSLETEGFTVEYIEDRAGRRLGAVVLEGVRLIDNIPWTENREGASS